MMLDTLKAVDTLKEHGFEDKQARAIATVVTYTNDELATKKDIELLRTDLQAQTTELHANDATLKSNINTLRWMVGLLYPLIFGVLIALLFR